MIKADSVNKKVWDDVLSTAKTQGSVRIVCIIKCMYMYNVPRQESKTSAVWCLTPNLQSAIIAVFSAIVNKIAVICGHTQCKQETNHSLAGGSLFVRLSACVYTSTFKH